MLLMHRRSLPHWYVPGAAHFVTYRLAGTLPANVVQALKDKKTKLLLQKSTRTPSEHKRHIHKVLFAAYEDYLDRVSEVDWLKDAREVPFARILHHAKSCACAVHAVTIGIRSDVSSR